MVVAQSDIKCSSCEKPLEELISSGNKDRMLFCRKCNRVVNIRNEIISPWALTESTIIESSQRSCFKTSSGQKLKFVINGENFMWKGDDQWFLDREGHPIDSDRKPLEGHFILV